MLFSSLNCCSGASSSQLATSRAFPSLPAARHLPSCLPESFTLPEPSSGSWTRSSGSSSRQSASSQRELLALGPLRQVSMFISRRRLFLLGLAESASCSHSLSWQQHFHSLLLSSASQLHQASFLHPVTRRKTPQSSGKWATPKKSSSELLASARMGTPGRPSEEATRRPAAITPVPATAAMGRLPGLRSTCRAQPAHVWSSPASTPS
mmetsp:Transcript_7393/g.16883  ORF Transcript_7393/g.16883 Transcript_7393/m.16883 type:complete len:208 (+) Transcript_7393:1111-1734(+)